ncbi:MAG TPA: molybdopterin molybdotransferase MoeA, partial [Gemmatales bacterium]|nr:molybdopterin molybdotransferase MoeA [Gemmatales bacterium]
GAEVLRPGQPLRPAVLGLLASLGRTHVSVFRRPIVAILATGDELVEAGESPGPGQILNSNTPLLAGLTHSQHGRPHTLGIARDTRESLHRHLAFGLEADVLLISGGVSAGKLDLVPEVLVELQVEVHFHKVAMKPGKPLLFGTRDSTLVFGLPGNPVSSLVGFELFVRPVLRRLRGLEPALVPPVRAQVTTELQHRSDRPTWYPAVVAPRGSGWEARPLPWQGSADLRALAGATGLIQLPAGELTLPAGAEVEAVLLAD